MLYNRGMEQKQRERFMREALRQAVKGAGAVAPNPQVGAVIVKNGLIVGKGYHKRFGGPHAEVEAIRNCRKKGNDPSETTMFVTLEPCCHQGKTPPCTEAIKEAGITCVEIATLDECELVAGKGAVWLRKQGIDIQVGCCAKEARQLNGGFFKLQKTSQPQVILKWAQSIDGKLAWPVQAKKRWITNEKARKHVHELRSRCGAVLVGIGTALADDPLLTVRLGKRTWQPRRVVLDSKLRISPESNLVQTAPKAPLVIYSLQSSIDQQQPKVDALTERDCSIRAVPYKNGQLDLSAVLKDLGRLGVTDLLVEGGAAILKSFWEEHLADKIMVYITPAIIGNAHNVPAIHFANRFNVLKDTQITKFDDDFLIEAHLADKANQASL